MYWQSLTALNNLNRKAKMGFKRRGGEFKKHTVQQRPAYLTEPFWDDFYLTNLHLIRIKIFNSVSIPHTHI